MKKKTILTLLITIIMILFAKNISNAANGTPDYTGLSGARDMIQADGKTLVGKQIRLTLSDMANSSNNLIYCIENGQRNSDYGTNFLYNVLSYIEIKDGRATVWDNSGNAEGALGAISDKSKVMAEILSGNYGLGYGSSVGNYTAAQRALYMHLKDWIDAWENVDGVQDKVVPNTDSSWFLDNGYVDNGTGSATLEAAQAAVANGANSSLKIFLLDNASANNWQRLLIAAPGDGGISGGGIEINKVNEKGQKMANVSFKLQCSGNATAGKWITATPVSGEVNTYQVTGVALEESGGTIFTTGVSSYQTIKLKGLNPDFYNVVEIENKNAGYAGNKNHMERLYLSTNTSTSITIVNRKDEPDDDPDPNPGTGTGKFKISGKVWVDSLDANKKAGSNNNEYDSNDKLLSGVKVHWYSTDGNDKLIQLGETTTGSDGTYSMTANFGLLDGNGHYRGISDARKAIFDRSYVVFEYNGLAYTTIANKTTLGDKNSVSSENAGDRTELDRKFQSVSYNNVDNAGYADTNFRDTFKNKTEKDKNWLTTSSFNMEHYKVTASTQNNITNIWSSHRGKATQTDTYYKKDGHKTCSDVNCNGTYSCGSPTCKGDHKCGPHQHCDTATYGKAWKVDNLNLGLVLREQPDISLEEGLNYVDVITNGQAYRYTYEEPSDVQYVIADYSVSVQNRKTGKYTRRLNPATIAYINEEEHNTEKDYLQVYVTYTITVINESNSLAIEVGEIANYYNKKCYTLDSGTVWSNTSSYGGVSYNSNSGDYGIAYTNDLKGTIIQPHDKQEVKIKFRVNFETLKDLIKANKEIENISEISAYTTFYQSGTICAENKKGTYAGSTYAGFDRDSVPGTTNPTNENTFEDDTSKAPTFVMEKDPNYRILSGTVYEDETTKTDNERNGNGHKDSGDKGIGNAKVELLKVNDNGTTEIAKLHYIDSSNSAQTIDAITYTDRDGHYAFGFNKKEIDGNEKQPQYYSGNTNNATTPIDQKLGVTEDTYIIKFTYGNDSGTYTKAFKSYINPSENNYPSTSPSNTINAKNYKSTIISKDNNNAIYGVIHNNNGDNLWHLNAGDEHSIAIDNLSERSSVDEELKYGTFDNSKDITASSQPFKIQLEYTQEQQQDVDANTGNKIDGSDFEHDWTIFDFGIAERAREDIVIDKTISNLKITLGNGQVLMDGNPREDKMDYLKYLGNDKGSGPNNTRDKARKAQSKLAYIEMDTELIQGATLDIIYTITVTNNSEKDYDYTTDSGRYYYYGDKSTSQEMPTTVELVADYMDPELTCYVGAGTENSNWEKVKVEDLKNDGLISDYVENVIGNDKYLIFETDFFKDVKTYDSANPNINQKSLDLHASKLLANSAEDYVYENHVEILKTNGQIARTIDKVDYNNGSRQNTKWYKPGNYIPSLSRTLMPVPVSFDYKTGTPVIDETAGIHAQDDDTITIRITPPTGISSYYTSYIIASAIGLIVIVGGIILIKKKVLGS